MHPRYRSTLFVCLLLFFVVVFSRHISKRLNSSKVLYDWSMVFIASCHFIHATVSDFMQIASSSNFHSPRCLYLYYTPLVWVGSFFSRAWIVSCAWQLWNGDRLYNFFKLTSTEHCQPLDTNCKWLKFPELSFLFLHGRSNWIDSFFTRA